MLLLELQKFTATDEWRQQIDSCCCDCRKLRPKKLWIRPISEGNFLWYYIIRSLQRLQNIFRLQSVASCWLSLQTILPIAVSMALQRSSRLVLFAKIVSRNRKTLNLIPQKLLPHSEIQTKLPKMAGDVVHGKFVRGILRLCLLRTKIFDLLISLLICSMIYWRAY